MTKARLNGLFFIALGSEVLLLWGIALANTSSALMVDFRAMYYPARCLLQHCDPYSETEVLRVYKAEGADRPPYTADARQIATQYPYPPTVFSLTVPFAMLPWGPAHMLWKTLTVGGLIFASFLAWDLGANFAPIISGALIGFLLANSELLLFVGNPAGIAVSLCVVAVWCFLRERFVPAGILCLAISLAIKPQDVGLVWAYFLLAGGVYRKRALQTLFVTAALGLPGVLWVWHVSPHWIQEMRSNILAYSVRGGMNDPASALVRAPGSLLISLQTVISIFWDDPRIYNPVSYLICVSFLLAWAFAALRSRSSLTRARLAMAAIAALSMLPVYHRQYDAKLLLLTVPACAMLWAEGGMIGRLALAVNTAGFVLTGDLTWAILLGRIGHLHLPTARLFGRILTPAQFIPVAPVLLTMSIFYLWVYLRRAPARGATTEPGKPEETLIASRNL